MALFGIYGQKDVVPLQAFAAGLLLLGHDVAWRDHNFWSGEREQFNAVVICGLRAQGRQIAEHYARLKIPLVVIDHGYMKRVHDVANYDTGFFQVGVNRLGWVPAQAPDVQRFEELGVEIKAPSARPLRRALICGQVAFDASHYMTEAELVQTYHRLAEALTAQGLKVVYRGHPQARGVNPPIPPDGIRSLDDALGATDVVASINSNAGLDALIAGVPAIILKDCHYQRVAYRWPVSVAAIRPPDPERLRSFLERLAWAQWTAAEMREGLPQAFLSSIGEIP